MTVAGTNSSINYPSAGAGATVFVYDFRIVEDKDLSVYVDDVLQVLITDYNVTGANDPAGGTVVFVTPLAGGESIDIVRNTLLDQQIDYKELDAFPAESHEQGLDKLTLQNQDMDRRVDPLEASAPGIEAHIADTSNPHSVTKDQVGLGNVDNVQQEPALGNPAANGYVLASSVGGVRSWTPQTAISTISAAITADAGDGTPEGDLNATDFTGFQGQAGSALAIPVNTVAYFTHKGTSYQWVGTVPALVGVGGTTTAVSADLSPVSGINPFRGALAYVVSPFAFADVSLVDVEFNATLYDTDNIHDNILAPADMVVPANVSFIRMSAQIDVTADNAGELRGNFNQNGGFPTAGMGSYDQLTELVAGANIAIINIVSGIIPVTPGDIMTLTVRRNTSGGNATVDIQRSWMQMEIIE